MICCGCDFEPINEEDMGLIVKPLGFVRGQKSGALLPEEDIFPDGTYEKFICWECLVAPPGAQSLAEMVGILEPGHDQPSPLEEFVEELDAQLQYMQTTPPEWGEGGYRPYLYR